MTVGMRKNPQVGLKGFVGHAALRTLQNFPLHAASEEAMMRKLDVSQKVDSLRILSKRDLAGMKLELERVLEKYGDFPEPSTQYFFVLMYDDKVVRVSDVVTDAEVVLYELIELVHVDIREKLARKVSDGDSRRKFSDDFHKERAHPFVLHPLFENAKKDRMIHGVEKLFDIALQDKAGERVVAAHLAEHHCHPFYALVISLSCSARIRIVDKPGLEHGVQHSKDRMMHHPVADCRFMNAPLFGIGNPESMIRSVPVASLPQLFLKLENPFLESVLEFGHVLLSPFSLLEFVPRRKKVFGREGFFKKMIVHIR